MNFEKVFWGRNFLKIAGYLDNLLSKHFFLGVDMYGSTLQGTWRG